MAEVNAEQKKWPGLLLKILALVVIGLGVWAGFQLLDEDTKTAQVEMPDRSVVVPATDVYVPAKVSEFASFIRDNPAEEMMELDHGYTSDGIRRLADALGAVADQQKISGGNIENQLDLLRSHADRLQQDRHSTEHADIVRDAFAVASDLITSIERQRAPDLEDDVAEVRRAAEAVDPDKLVLDQKAEVEAFFKKTSRLLNVMSKHRS
jgi:hypothetical protein